MKRKTEKQKEDSAPAPATAGKKKGGKPTWFSAENPPNYDVVSVKPEYQFFIRWSATLKPLRNPPKQDDLAKKMHLRPEEFSRWKLMPEFRQDVARQVLSNLSDMSSDVLQSWALRLHKQHTAADIRLWLEYVNDFKSSLSLDSPELKRMADRFDEMVEGKGLRVPGKKE